MTNTDVAGALLESVGVRPKHDLPEDVAHIEVHQNEVVGVHLVPGLEVDAQPTADGIDAHITIGAGAVIEKPVHICFGILPEEGQQHLNLIIDVGEASHASVLAHCTFPNAVRIEHKMNAEITVAAGAKYSYFERHVHGPSGGVLVLPYAHVTVHEGGSFATEFELIRGRAGQVDIDYDCTCHARSILEMTARINGRGDDRIGIRETAHLIGEEARAVLTSNIAVRDDAQADVYNSITASAPRARGHVDCKEIILGNARAKATPIVDVQHPTAHVTHEAAIGSVDSKQLQTLLTRGLTEDEATELIIDGLLSKT